MCRVYDKISSFENLHTAFKNASKGKRLKKEVLAFEYYLEHELYSLHHALRQEIYTPGPYQKFILETPRNRVICKASFRDRVLHHALINCIQPLFEMSFIHDSYACIQNKGTTGAHARYDQFKYKTTGRKHPHGGWILKFDIRHFFPSVNHTVLKNILSNKIKCEKTLRLIDLILTNYQPECGLPIGNLTSQFFANLYLNELDRYIKHTLKITRYIRYMDDAVIFSEKRQPLVLMAESIQTYVSNHLQLTLHPDKTRIYNISSGISFLGFKLYYHHKLLLHRNRRRFLSRKKEQINLLNKKEVTLEDVRASVASFSGFAKHANTWNFRKKHVEGWYGTNGCIESSSLF